MSKIISQKRFISNALDAHNKYRKLHGVDPLEHSPDLSDSAQDWAEHLASNNILKYKNSKYNDEFLGENILRAYTAYIDGDEVSDMWYKEEANYKYDGTFQKNSGHFTQMVWKNTRKVGFGFAVTDKGTFYMVANYYPPGNYKNEFNLNVFRPRSLNLLVVSVPDFRKTEPAKKEPNQNIISNIVKMNQVEPNKLNTSFDEMQNRFIYEALESHNSCRKKHGSPPLIHNPELSKIAQDYATYLVKIKSLKHSGSVYKNEKLGENLSYSYDSNSDYCSGEKVTMQWYNEERHHNYNNDYQSASGHFTQVVWKSSKDVGFGIARSPDGAFFAVANYYPAGNVMGTYIRNVPKSL